MTKALNTFLTLGKVRISLLATLTAALGCILASGQPLADLVVTVPGVFLLACGAGALNQFQERDIDSRMQRTQRRPLVVGTVSPSAALAYALVFILSGCSILLLGANLTAMSLGLLAIAWYNGVYTYLKRFTALAVVPGSLVGAVPPVLGWTAAGGSLWDPSILAVGCFFFIWQVPHFWLLLLRFGQDYERAGLPSLTQRFTLRQLMRITFVWIASTAVASLVIPLYGGVDSVVTNALLLAASAWLVWTSLHLLRSRDAFSFRGAFKSINVYALLVIVLLSIGKLSDTTPVALSLLVQR